jgi:hypothetical protein
MRPALKSGLLPVWRDRDTLQIGIDPRRAIALSGMAKAAFVIGLLDGSRERDQIIAAAAGRGIPAQATERILTLLAAGGALDDFPASTFREIPYALRAKLGPELATTSLAHRDGDGGARALARRRAAVVRIEGDQRIGRAAARILTAAGVGQVEFIRPPVDSTPAELSRPAARPAGWPRYSPPAADSSQADRNRRPVRAGQAGLAPPPAGAAGDRGRSRGPGRAAPSRPPAAVRRRRAGPGSGPHAEPDLVILAGRQSLVRLAELARERVPHLAVFAGEAIGVVGPMVMPRLTACLLCLDYVRAGNDPAWPLILAQLGRRKPDPPACDAVLATAVAAQAAAQALIAIEKSPLSSAAVNGTLELVLPDWKWRRRTWPPHPACPCANHTAR